MAILALATSGPAPQLGLALPDGRVFTQDIEAGRGRGRDVAPRLAALLAGQGIEVGDLRRIAVDVGPGSFTGVRVGVTMAKTLAFARGGTVVAMDSLALLAASCEHPGEVVCVRDAGRGTCYYAAYGAPESGGRACTRAPVRGSAASLQALSATGPLLAEDVTTLAEGLGWTGTRIEGYADVRALLAYAAGASARVVPAHDLAPLYLQASAPERLKAGE